jgi:hypothetical protein
MREIPSMEKRSCLIRRLLSLLCAVAFTRAKTTAAQSDKSRTSKSRDRPGCDILNSYTSDFKKNRVEYDGYFHNHLDGISLNSLKSLDQPRVFQAPKPYAKLCRKEAPRSAKMPKE